MSEDDAMVPEPGGEPWGPPWKILVVGEDPEVHAVTERAIKGFLFLGRPIEMLRAASGAEALGVLSNDRDIALILLDIATATDGGGLALVAHIREELDLHALRIVLLASRPDEVPAPETMLCYDITDCRSDITLTARNVVATVALGLRGHERFRVLERADAQLAERSRALLTARQHCAALMKAVPDAVVTADASGAVRSFSPAAEHLFGWQAVEVVGKPVSLLFKKDGLLGAHGQIPDGVAHGTGAGELDGVRKDDSTFPMEFSLNEAEIDGEAVFVAVLRDVTEKRLARQALGRAKEAAEQSARAKSEFLAMMSHEMRTPLNGILGMAQLLLDSGVTAEQRGYAETIARSGRSLLSVLNDILDFSNLEDGRVNLEEAEFDPNRLVSGVLSLMADRAAEKGLRLAAEPAGDLPAKLLGDPSRVRRVLLNLVSNAIKFTERGSVTIGLRREREAESDSRVALRFMVADTGIGIPESVIGILFNRFVQGDSSISRRYGGTGLGLAASKKIVTQMGGEIGVDSRSGLGSTFWFTLKLPAASATDQVAAPPPEQNAMDILVFDGLRTALGDHEMVNILRLFISDAQSLLGKLNEAVTEANRAAVAKISNDLRRSAGSFGFEALRMAAEQIAASAPQAPLHEMADRVTALQSVFRGALAALAQRCPEAAVSSPGTQERPHVVAG